MTRAPRATPAPTAVAAVLLAVIAWGLAPVLTRYLVGHLFPLTLLLARFSLASVLFLPLVFRLKQQPWSRADWMRGVLCGLIGILGYNIPVTFGAQWIPAHTIGILIASEPLWMLAFAVVFFRERPMWTLFGGALLALLGVGIIVGGLSLAPAPALLSLAGIGLVLLGAMCFALYSLLLRPLSQAYGAVTATGVTTIIGTLPLWLFFPGNLLTQVAHLSWATISLIGALSLGSTVLGTICWNYGMARLSGARGGVFLNLVPLVSIWAGVFFLQERLEATVIIGGPLLLAGIVLAQIKLTLNRRSVQRAPADAPQRSTISSREEEPAVHPVADSR